MKFELTEEHVKLLRRAQVQWHDCEHGAPEIDPKRPYGNSYVDVDIAEILGEEPQGVDRFGDPDYSPEQKIYFQRIHRETEIALQIMLCVGCMELGIYENAYDVSKNWKLVSPVPKDLP